MWDDSKKFVSQKVTDELCENDFECQSNKCVDRKCGQNNRITITEIFKDEGILVKDLFFREEELFYFKGSIKNYSIGFGRNESDFVFLINNNFYNMSGEPFRLDNNSQIVLKSIFHDDDVAYANVTFIESKEPFEDSKKILGKINCKGIFLNETCREEREEFVLEGKKYKIENLSLVEIQEEEHPLSSITGAVVRDKENTKNEGVIRKLLNWIKNIFG